MISHAVLGNLAKNWSSLNKEEAAIIVNPAASSLDVLAWCWGEVESLRHAAIALSGEDECLDGEAVYAVFLHRLSPLSTVMHGAIHALVTSEAQRQAALQQGVSV